MRISTIDSIRKPALIVGPLLLMATLSLFRATGAPAMQPTQASRAVTVKGEDKNMGYSFDVALDERRNKLYVAGADAGMFVFRVQDGELRFITSVVGKGYYRNLKITGDRLFLADSDRGLVVYDISGDVPVKTWAQGKQGKGMGMGIHVEGRRAYLAWGKEGLAIFDIANPDSPKLIGHCAALDDAWDVWVKGGYAYIAELDEGIVTIDISDPSKPKRIGVTTWGEKKPTPEIVRGEGNALFVAAGPHGLIALSLSDPAHPRLTSIFHPSESSFAEGLCVRDGLVYLANGHGGSRHDNGLIVVDARKLDSLKELGRCCFLGWVEGVCVSGAHAFVANTFSGVRSVNIVDPAKPVLKDSFGPIRDPYYDTHLDTPLSAEEKLALEELAARKKEILAGKECVSQTTPNQTFLTLLWATKSADFDLFTQVFPHRGARMNPKQFKEGIEKDIKYYQKAEAVRVSTWEPRGDQGALCAIYLRESEKDLSLEWDAYVFQRQNDGAWKLLFNTGRTDGPAWRKWVSESSLLEEKDPLSNTEMSSKETQAIEEFRRLKERILAAESYSDASTPLHAVLSHLSNLEPGDTRDYFMGFDIFRAPLPPDQAEEGTIWPVFAGHKALAETFVVGHSNGQWIWLGNYGNNGDWRGSKSFWEKQLKQKSEDPRITGLRKRIDELAWTGEGDKARQLFDEAQSIERKDLRLPWGKLGLCLYDGKHYAQALQSFKKDFKENPASYSSLVWQGHLLDLTNQREEALACYQEVLKHWGPDDGVRHDQFGIVIDRAWVEERIKTPFRRGD
jgi:tetratricopeptide (TPR) repeat protein